MIKRLYPGGKPKAFSITYDDGVLQDVRFVQLLNRYGLKGTFNLNSQLMSEEFEWTHEKGIVIKRLSPEKAVQLYAGHEVASHSLTHPYMHDMDESGIMYQLGKDRENLERLFRREIRGFAVPFSYYSGLIASCAQKCGFEYSRCSDESYSYTPPADYYHWCAGAYHMNPRWREFANGFFTTDTELALCQIVGHSYDLDTEDMWEEMENLLKRVSEDKNIMSLTNIELVHYLKDIRSVDISTDIISNHTETDLWFETDRGTVCVKSGGKLKLY